MNKENKYECIAKILFKRLVKLEIQTNKVQEILEQANNFIRIYTEVDSVLPLNELSEYFYVDTIDSQNTFFNKTLELTTSEDDIILNNKINDLFEQYIK